MAFFNFGKNRKSQGAVRWIRWMVHFLMEFLARNSRTLNASYVGALLWCRIHLSDQSPGRFLRTHSRNLSALPNNTVDLPFVLVQWIYSELSPCDRRNTQAWPWPATETCVLFRPIWILCFPLHALSFGFRVVLKTPRFITGNNPALRKRSDEMKSWRSGHLSRFGVPFLRNFFSHSQIFLYNLSHCFSI
jgi:hypothetical protein